MKAVWRWGLCPCCPGMVRCLSGVYNHQSPVAVGGVRLGVWGVVLVLCVCVGVGGVVLSVCVCVTC